MPSSTACAFSTLAAGIYRYMEERLDLLWRNWYTRELLEQYLAPIVPRGEAIGREAILLMGLIDGLALRLMLQTGRGDRIHLTREKIAAAVRSHLRAMEARYR